MKYLLNVKVTLIFIITLSLIISGCAVKYVADYDASVQEEIFQIAKKVDLFWGALLDMEKSKRVYEKFKDQYNQIETDIRGLVMKHEVRALNKESTKQANIALSLWIEDRNIHKEKNTFSDFEAKSHREQYTRVFTAMAKGEGIKPKENSNSNDSKGENK
jgi:hypothetical protein